MKRNLSILFLMLAGIVLSMRLAAAQSQNAQQSDQPKQEQQTKPAEPAKQPERIAVTDLKKKLESGEKMLLIDVREDWELKADGAIPGAIHIPVADLDSRMKDIPKDVQLVFY